MNYCNMDYAICLQNIMENGYEYVTRGSKRKRVKVIPCNFVETPLVSLRSTAWKNALREWEWFMSGSNNIHDLHPSVRDWWKPWEENEVILYNYSQQFREFSAVNEYAEHESFDQIEWLINAIKTHPNSTRNLITTWNPHEMQLPDCKITNCHGTIVHAFVEDNKLSLVTYQRSCDMVCGVPHNWIQYWAFLMWLAYRTEYKVGELTWIGGDCHIYDEHTPIAKEIVAAWTSGHGREKVELVYSPPLVSGVKNEIPEFKADDFHLIGDYVPAILTRAKMIV